MYLVLNVGIVCPVWDILQRNGPNTQEHFVGQMLSPGPMAIVCLGKVNMAEMTPVACPSCAFVCCLINSYKEHQELILQITVLILFVLGVLMQNGHIRR